MALRMKTGAAATSSSVSKRRVFTLRGGKRVRGGMREAGGVVRAAKREEKMVDEVEQRQSGKAGGVVIGRIVSAVSSPRVWQTAAAAQLLVAGAAHAEAGKLFDFDLTLPIMVAQFLLLMKFLDSKLFTPVGNIMDERAKGVKIIRAALSEKQEARNAASNENKKLLDQGRAAADAYVKGMQKKAMEQVEEMVNENKKEIEAEVAVASASVMAKVKIAEDKLIAEKPVIVQLVIDKLAGKTVMKELSTPETLPSEEVKEPATVEV